MLSYSDLRDIQKKEMSTSAVVQLPEDFYSAVFEMLSKKGADVQLSKSLLAIKEYENLRKIIVAIQAKREEKIVLMAVRGEREGRGLTSEEKELLKGLSSIIEESRKTVTGVWNKEDTVQKDARRIKIIKSVSQYRGLDNSIYGPFEPGEEKSLPQPEVEWLLKSGLAELL